MKHLTPSLLSRIKRAESLEEIARLLEEGGQYNDASPQTRARWHRFAAKRRKELEQ